MWLLTRDGKRVMEGSYTECVQYLHRTHPYSASHALTHEGYKLEMRGSERWQSATR